VQLRDLGISICSERLLHLPRVCPSTRFRIKSRQATAMLDACAHGQLGAVIRLLADTRVELDDFAVIAACAGGHARSCEPPTARGLARRSL